MNKPIKNIADTNRRRGFTIVELIVVIAIISLLAGGAALTLPKILGGARADSAMNDLRVIENAIKIHEVSNPGWSSLSELPLEPDSLIDPWGNPYRVLRNETYNGRTYKYVLASNGEDGVPDGSFSDQSDDIVHTIE